MTIDALFVYGTLLPGQARWHFLEPFVEPKAHPDSISAQLFDTVDDALRMLDDVEGAVRGLYRRVAVTTQQGRRAWVYEYGADPADNIDLIEIPDGDWLRHSNARPARDIVI